jgi:hypothetical protein
MSGYLTWLEGGMLESVVGVHSAVAGWCCTTKGV